MKTEPETRAMLKKLNLTNFKNFKEAELTLGPFTLLVGANATGKSNIREAFRFLHGIGRGYKLAEIIGERRTEAGELVWHGIRGGTRELVYFGEPDLTLEVTLDFPTLLPVPCTYYRTDIGIGEEYMYPQVIDEVIGFCGQEPIYELAGEKGWYDDLEDELGFAFGVYNFGIPAIATGLFPLGEKFSTLKTLAQLTNNAFSSMRFLDLSPSIMRMPSFPGQTVLVDRGENFSSVLHSICQDPKHKQTLISWVQELTPMDIVDFDFYTNEVGQIRTILVERDGRKMSVFSTSDGTLRFLGLLVSLLSPEPARLYFFEELENGIHPNRLHLLIELIEQVTAERGIQVVATTHSPVLLDLISEETLEYASLVYRLEGSPDGRIQRILDIPHARQVLNESDLGRLFENGWLENSALFMNDPEPAL